MATMGMHGPVCFPFGIRRNTTVRSSGESDPLRLAVSGAYRPCIVTQQRARDAAWVEDTEELLKLEKLAVTVCAYL